MIDNLASWFNYLLVKFICRKVFLEFWDAKQSGNMISKLQSTIKLLKVSVN